MDISENSDVTVRLRARRRITFAAAVCVALALALAFLGVGRWLVVEDHVEKADAVVVLSGRMPLRALEASKLFRQGYAPQVWLTRSREPGETLEAMGIRFQGEEHYNTRILIHEGVPADAIHILEPPILNTADEIKAISATLERRKGGSVILVTSKVHTRRTRLLWRKLSSGKSRAIVRAASEDPFDPGHWWRDTGDALDVVREVLGLVNAWAGLPLTPAHRSATGAECGNPAAALLSAHAIYIWQGLLAREARILPRTRKSFKRRGISFVLAVRSSR